MVGSIVECVSLKNPHILLAAKNTREMLENIRHIIDAGATRAIEDEIEKNTQELFALGEEHYDFAKHTAKSHWRQRISRFYYGAYNVRRAIQLYDSGVYSTDSSDHKKIDQMPQSLNNIQTYKNKLRSLREDRNLADYDHSASESDLVFTQDDYEQLVTDFINDARTFLTQKGVSL